MKAPRHIAAVLSLLLAGCGTQLQQIKVPLPVACQAEEPTRPAMPTDALRPGADIDRYVAASQAEIEIREGYELELRAALSECKPKPNGDRMADSRLHLRSDDVG